MSLPPEVRAILERCRKIPTPPPEPTLVPELPSGPIPVVLTRNLIHAGKSAAGGWNKAQLAAIGIAWSELRHRGWIDRNVGRVVTADEYAEFIELRKVFSPTAHEKAPAEPGR